MTSIVPDKLEYGAEKDDDDMVDGVNMRHLGQLDDLRKYFDERLAHPDECLWPELESLEIRYKYLNTRPSVDDQPSIMGMMRKFRREVRVDVQKQIQYI